MAWKTDDASDELKVAPVFKEILKTEKLASQPTVSRWNNELDKNTFKMMDCINISLLDNAYKIENPEFVILDIDSTHTETYGKQYGSSYNYHYSFKKY